MSDERLNVCGTCAYWQRATAAPGAAPPRYGTCRIRPPAIGANGGGCFPVIDDTEWCGQHQPETTGNEPPY